MRNKLLCSTFAALLLGCGGSYGTPPNGSKDMTNPGQTSCMYEALNTWLVTEYTDSKNHMEVFSSSACDGPQTALTEIFMANDGSSVAFSKEVYQPVPAIVGIDLDWKLNSSTGLLHVEIWNVAFRLAEHTITNNMSQHMALRSTDKVMGSLMFRFSFNTQAPTLPYSSTVSNVSLVLPTN